MGMKSMFKKSSDQFNKDGFYIILFVCLCIVAVSAVYISRHNTNMVKKNAFKTQKVEQQQPQNSESVLNSEQEEKSLSVSGQGQTSISNAASTKKIDTVKKMKHHETTLSLTWPVKGDVTKKFDKNKLQESKTLQQWETHEGIDIASDMGTEVKAAQKGKIVDVFKDDTVLQDLKSGFGVTIVIDHGDGYRTMYSNLTEDVKVKKGDEVKQSQVIGYLGDSAVREVTSIEGSHLHFEVLKKSGKDYVTVNPLNYMK